MHPSMSPGASPSSIQCLLSDFVTLSVFPGDQREIARSLSSVRCFLGGQRKNVRTLSSIQCFLNDFVTLSVFLCDQREIARPLSSVRCFLCGQRKNVRSLISIQGSLSDFVTLSVFLGDQREIARPLNSILHRNLIPNNPCSIHGLNRRYSVHGLKRPLLSPSEAWQDRGEAGLNDRDPRSPLRPVREPRSTRLIQSVLRNLGAFVLLSGFSLGSRSASCALRLQVHKLCTPRRPPSNPNVNDRHWTGQLALAQNV